MNAWEQLLKAQDYLVNSPPHYKSNSGLEAIQVIEAFELGFALGNTVKYILRAGKKGPVLQDLEKARWYLDREIKRQREVLDGTTASEIQPGSPQVSDDKETGS